MGRRGDSGRAPPTLDLDPTHAVSGVITGDLWDDLGDPCGDLGGVIISGDPGGVICGDPAV